MRFTRQLAGTLIFVLCFMSASSALCGSVTPALQKQMTALKADDWLTVLVVMKDQADIHSLDQNLHAEKALLSTRHLTIINALRDVAARTQPGLLASLQDEKKQGGVLGFTPHWLINAVVVRATTKAIDRLAAHPGVARIEPNLVVDLIGPVQGSELESPANKSIGMAPGLVAIRADQVWEDWGITGQGALIGTLDTGVDGTHPALASRWRGNFAPVQECWLDAAELGGPTFPTDQYGHGTHVTGTVTGLAENDTIGVAPGAQWIASNGIYVSSGEMLDNSILASLEWFADPDGDPATMDDVPDVVQNSWGVNESFEGYYDCDSSWWDAIDNCEAAGVVLIFSAGNEGPGEQTLRSPADRAATPYNCFSVGSTSAYEPFILSSFSSNGPAGSGCGPEEFRIKPEVCAPGSNIYSAMPGGGYQYLSGTSMSGPHVAGVVALIRSANANVDVTTIKQVLMESARDLGAMGNDNEYGHGFIDAYAAVVSVIDGIGIAEGYIFDIMTGSPLEGAMVRLVDGYQNTLTDELGFYRLTLPAGQWNLVAEIFGYQSGVLSVTVTDNETITTDRSLIPLGKHNLSGLVLDPEGVPVSGAVLSFLNAPLPEVITAADGSYSVDLPGLFAYVIKAEATDFGPDIQEIGMYWPIVHDFHLSVLDRDGFETGDFSANNWQHEGHEFWMVTDATSHGGAFSARSGSITDNGLCHLSVERTIAAAGIISFAVRTSCEESYDSLIFAMDGQEAGRWSGDTPWNEVAFPVEAGTHVFSWTYAKDTSISFFDDTVWLDNVTFPNNGSAVLVVDQTTISMTTVPGGGGLKSLLLENIGPSPLHFNLGLSDGSVGKQIELKTTANYPKGELDRRSSEVVGLGSGGPDGSGYRWVDDNHPGGPAFQWVELEGVGEEAGRGDDTSLGPFSLGFSFPYYGAVFDSLRICTNGFASFTSSAQAYANQGIPTLAEPNNMVAPFWTDLDVSSTGAIYYYHDQANHRFVVQWNEVPHYNSNITETFQMILYPDGSLLFQYQDVGDGGTCTVGLENGAGNDGLQVVFNAPYLENERAILFTNQAPVSWLSVTPETGEIAAGEALPLEVLFSAYGMSEGIYEARIILRTNDPMAEEIIIPVSFTVGGIAGEEDELPATKTVLLGAVPNPFNATTEIRFTLADPLVVSLDLFDVSGRLVKNLFQGPCSAGGRTVLWRGTDEQGRSVSSGTYFARLRGPGVNLVKSVVLVR